MEKSPISPEESEKLSPIIPLPNSVTKHFFANMAKEAVADLECATDEESAQHAIDKIDKGFSLVVQASEEPNYYILMTAVESVTRLMHIYDIKTKAPTVYRVIGAILKTNHPALMSARKNIRNNILPPRHIMNIIDTIHEAIPDKNLLVPPEIYFFNLYINSPREAFIEELRKFCAQHDIPHEELSDDTRDA